MSVWCSTRVSSFSLALTFFRYRNENILGMHETDQKWTLSFVINHPSQVYIHSTEEVSSYDILPQFLWELNFAVDLWITMKQTYTTNDTNQLTIAQRKCVFHDEVDLTYHEHDIYSLSACMKQCRMQKANKLCKCIPPFYKPATGAYKDCELSDFQCLRVNQQKIISIRDCKHCELSCLSTVYDSEKFINK